MAKKVKVRLKRKNEDVAVLDKDNRVAKGGNAWPLRVGGKTMMLKDPSEPLPWEPTNEERMHDRLEAACKDLVEIFRQNQELGTKLSSLVSRAESVLAKLEGIDGAPAKNARKDRFVGEAVLSEDAPGTGDELLAAIEAKGLKAMRRAARALGAVPKGRILSKSECAAKIKRAKSPKRIALAMAAAEEEES